MKIRHLGRVGLAAATSFCLLLTSSGAAWAEASIWAERRAARAQRQVASLPARDIDLSFAPAAGAAAIVTRSLAETAARKDPQLLRLQGSPLLNALPLSHANVREAHWPAGAISHLVVHIQDVHGHRQAQDGIGKAVAWVAEDARRRGAPPVLVGMEGAAGEFLVDAFRAHADGAALERLARPFYDKHLLTGAEFAALTAPAAPALWGIETPELYLRHVDALKGSFPREAALRAAIDALKARLGRAQAAAYPPALRDWSARFDAYHAGREGLGGYVRFLAEGLPMAGRPNVALFLTALDKEQKLDFKAAEADRQVLVESLARRLDAARLRALTDRAVDFRLGRASYSEFHAALTAAARAAGLSMAGFPSFQAYVRYVDEVEKINRSKLLTEIDALESAAADRALAGASPEARRLHEAAGDLHGVEKLLARAMTPPDWDRYTPRRTEAARLPERLGAAAGDFAADLAAFEAFYEVAVLRNDALVDNLLARDAARGVRGPRVSVLVAGGFHTDGMVALLKKKGVAVVVMTPRIDKAGAHDYLDVFRKDETPLARLFEGEKLTLVAPLNLPAKSMNGRLPTIPFCMEAVRAVKAAGMDSFEAFNGILLAMETFPAVAKNHFKVGLSLEMREKIARVTLRDQKDKNAVSIQVALLKPADLRGWIEMDGAWVHLEPERKTKRVDFFKMGRTLATAARRGADRLVWETRLSSELSPLAAFALKHDTAILVLSAGLFAGVVAGLASVGLAGLSAVAFTGLMGVFTGIIGAIVTVLSAERPRSSLLLFARRFLFTFSALAVAQAVTPLIQALDPVGTPQAVFALGSAFMASPILFLGDWVTLAPASAAERATMAAAEEHVTEDLKNVSELIISSSYAGEGRAAVPPPPPSVRRVSAPAAVAEPAAPASDATPLMDQDAQKILVARSSDPGPEAARPEEKTIVDSADAISSREMTVVAPNPLSTAAGERTAEVIDIRTAVAKTSSLRRVARAVGTQVVALEVAAAVLFGVLPSSTSPDRLDVLSGQVATSAATRPAPQATTAALPSAPLPAAEDIAPVPAEPAAQPARAPVLAAVPAVKRAVKKKAPVPVVPVEIPQPTVVATAKPQPAPQPVARAEGQTTVKPFDPETARRERVRTIIDIVALTKPRAAGETASDPYLTRAERLEQIRALAKQGKGPDGLPFNPFDPPTPRKTPPVNAQSAKAGGKPQARSGGFFRGVGERLARRRSATRAKKESRVATRAESGHISSASPSSAAMFLPQPLTMREGWTLFGVAFTVVFLFGGGVLTLNTKTFGSVLLPAMVVTAALYALIVPRISSAIRSLRPTHPKAPASDLAPDGNAGPRRAATPPPLPRRAAPQPVEPTEIIELLEDDPTIIELLDDPTPVADADFRLVDSGEITLPSAKALPQEKGRTTIRNLNPPPSSGGSGAFQQNVDGAATFRNALKAAGKANPAWLSYEVLTRKIGDRTMASFFYKALGKDGVWEYKHIASGFLPESGSMSEKEINALLVALQSWNEGREKDEKNLAALFGKINSSNVTTDQHFPANGYWVDDLSRIAQTATGLRGSPLTDENVAELTTGSALALEAKAETGDRHAAVLLNVRRLKVLSIENRKTLAEAAEKARQGDQKASAQAAAARIARDYHIYDAPVDGGLVRTFFRMTPAEGGKVKYDLLTAGFLAEGAVQDDVALADKLEALHAARKAPSDGKKSPRHWIADLSAPSASATFAAAAAGGDLTQERFQAVRNAALAMHKAIARNNARESRPEGLVAATLETVSTEAGKGLKELVKAHADEGTAEALFGPAAGGEGGGAGRDGGDGDGEGPSDGEKPEGPRGDPWEGLNDRFYFLFHRAEGQGLLAVVMSKVNDRPVVFGLVPEGKFAPDGLAETLNQKLPAWLALGQVRYIPDLTNPSDTRLAEQAGKALKVRLERELRTHRLAVLLADELRKLPAPQDRDDFVEGFIADAKSDNPEVAETAARTLLENMGTAPGRRPSVEESRLILTGVLDLIAEAPYRSEETVSALAAAVQGRVFVDIGQPELHRRAILTLIEVGGLSSDDFEALWEAEQGTTFATSVYGGYLASAAGDLAKTIARLQRGVSLGAEALASFLADFLTETQDRSIQRHMLLRTANNNLDRGSEEQMTFEAALFIAYDRLLSSARETDEKAILRLLAFGAHYSFFPLLAEEFVEARKEKGLALLEELRTHTELLERESQFENFQKGLARVTPLKNVPAAEAKPQARPGTAIVVAPRRTPPPEGEVIDELEELREKVKELTATKTWLTDMAGDLAAAIARAANVHFAAEERAREEQAKATSFWKGMGVLSAIGLVFSLLLNFIDSGEGEWTAPRKDAAQEVSRPVETDADLKLEIDLLKAKVRRLESERNRAQETLKAILSTDASVDGREKPAEKPSARPAPAPSPEPAAAPAPDAPVKKTGRSARRSKPAEPAPAAPDAGVKEAPDAEPAPAEKPAIAPSAPEADDAAAPEPAPVPVDTAPAKPFQHDPNDDDPNELFPPDPAESSVAPAGGWITSKLAATVRSPVALAALGGVTLSVLGLLTPETAFALEDAVHIARFALFERGDALFRVVLDTPAALEMSVLKVLGGSLTAAASGPGFLQFALFMLLPVAGMVLLTDARDARERMRLGAAALRHAALQALRAGKTDADRFRAEMKALPIPAAVSGTLGDVTLLADQADQDGFIRAAASSLRRRGLRGLELLTSAFNAVRLERAAANAGNVLVFQLEKTDSAQAVIKLRADLLAAASRPESKSARLELASETLGRDELAEVLRGAKIAGRVLIRNLDDAVKTGEGLWSDDLLLARIQADQRRRGLNPSRDIAVVTANPGAWVISDRIIPAIGRALAKIAEDIQALGAIAINA